MSVENISRKLLILLARPFMTQSRVHLVVREDGMIEC